MTAFLSSSGGCNYYANVSPSIAPSFADERRIASSQSGDRERDPKNAGKTGLPSRSALNEKAIRENIQTLDGWTDGGGDRDVVITERDGGGMPFKRDHLWR